MAEPTPSEAARMLRSMARGAGIGLVPGHNHDAMALLAGADALEQLQATRDEVRDLDWRLAEANNKLAATRDRHAALEGHVAELADVLSQLLGHIGMPFPIAGQSETVTAKIRQALIDRAHAALQTPPPAAGQAILHEVERLRDRVRQEPCENCYERCCGAGDQCQCHMWPWDDIDQTAPEEVEDG